MLLEHALETANMTRLTVSSLCFSPELRSVNTTHVNIIKSHCEESYLVSWMLVCIATAGMPGTITVYQANFFHCWSSVGI